MNESAPPVTVALRIPGRWAHPRELIQRLPEGYRLTPEALILPDGTPIDFGAMPADSQFAGGSEAAARTMMRAGAALVRVGGAGVFIDNGALAHGGQDWLELTDDGGPDALSFAFVGIVGGRAEVRTVGFHVLGLRDVVMKRGDVEEGGFDIVEVIRYLARGEKPVGDGHIIADLNGPQFRAVAEAGAEESAGSPLHNPFGRLRLVRMKDIAGNN